VHLVRFTRPTSHTYSLHRVLSDHVVSCSAVSATATTTTIAIRSAFSIARPLYFRRRVVSVSQCFASSSRRSNELRQCIVRSIASTLPLPLVRDHDDSTRPADFDGPQSLPVCRSDHTHITPAGFTSHSDEFPTLWRYTNHLDTGQ
jgi:hypothetical protein